jgi:hypothetical protein
LAAEIDSQIRVRRDASSAFFSHPLQQNSVSRSYYKRRPSYFDQASARPRKRLQTRRSLPFQLVPHKPLEYSRSRSFVGEPMPLRIGGGGGGSSYDSSSDEDYAGEFGILVAVIQGDQKVAETFVSLISPQSLGVHNITWRQKHEFLTSKCVRFVLTLVQLAG